MKMKKKLTNLLKIGTLFFGVSLILWNCEKNSETIEPVQETIDFTLKPKIENFSLSQLNQDKDFNNLKDNFNILQTKYLSKSNKNSSARLVDTLGITIDANSIKRISYDNYVSYTMLMIEPENTSSNFSNLVIQEYNGVKRIFTVRYLPSQNKSKKSSYSSKSSTESFNGDIQMSSGITTTELWGDDDGGGGGGSGTSNCEEYETVCNTLLVYVPHGCSCKGHMPWENCACPVDGGQGPYYTMAWEEECEDICKWDNYNDQNGDNNNNSTGGGGNTGNNNNSNPTNVATTPVNPNGTDAFQIINQLTGKAKCVYEKLESTSSGFKNAIKKFDGEFPVSHLSLITEDLGNTRGETRAPNGAGSSPDYVITIAINSNSNIHGVNYRPNLMTAKTIAHEVIHAEMFRKLLSLAKQGNLNFASWTRQQQINFTLAIKNDFPGIYDYYRRHKDWQHEQMASHYRQTIADILKDFDNNQHPNQFYLDIAWEGLIKSNISSWTSLSQQEQDRIKKVISDYINTNKNESC